MGKEISKIRVTTLRQMKEAGRKIAMLTAYDTITGRWADAGGIDVVLVGDSLGNTALGLDNPTQVTLRDMLPHCVAVARGVRRALRVGDMPFMTYKISPEQALENCGRMIQESNMEAVKLEGGREVALTVERLVGAGIPVMGHIGLTPQSYHAMGGYRVQGRDEAAAQRLLDDAQALAAAGAFALVLEGIPAELAARITAELAIPTIGIGAGGDCDGQVLVLADMLGMTDTRRPRLARQYADFYSLAQAAIQTYAQEVRDGDFPGPENTYGG